MSISPLDSALYGTLLCDPAALALLDEAAQIAAMLRFQAALAEAEGEVGVIPAEAATRIAEVASAIEIDPQSLAAGTSRDGVPVPDLVAALRQAVGGEAAAYVHWGATSQDVTDTGLVLRLCQLLSLYEERIEALGTLLAALAERHRHDVVVGRTRSQQATPTTFGLKAAGWLAPLRRHRDRLKELKPRLLVLSFGGAAGTLSALGDKALAVEAVLARRLSLRVAAMPWHSQRDALLELGAWLAGLSGSLGKMGQDLALMAQSEVGEVRMTGGGSSTMPNKVNPVAAETLVSLARFNAGQLGTLGQAALQEHERGGAGWTLEWMSLPQMAAAAAASLVQARSCLEGLEVRTARMRANLEAAQGLPLAEAASFALSTHMPRAEAQKLVKEACAKALEQGRGLFQVLAERSDTALDWTELGKPENSLGAADGFIDRVLADWRGH